MKFPISRTLNAAKRTALIKGLSIVAEKYFNAEYVYTGCGICAAVDFENIKNANYITMASLMNEILEEKGTLGRYTNEREQWEERANMCLLFVEYLKDTIND
jgi:MoxR-like ATPase